MKIDKRIIIILIIVIIIAIGCIFLLKKSDDKILEQSSIDVNDEEYKNSKIYVKDGEITIENPEGGKTIETTKTVEKSDMEKADDKVKNSYDIKDVKVISDGSMTTVKGKITNNEKKEHKVQITIKFYNEKDRIAGTNSMVIDNLKSKETREFTMNKMMGDYSNNKYKIEVEFTN